jgi:hypothetical protein
MTAKAEIPPANGNQINVLLRLSEGRAGKFICCMTKIAGEA